jgi:hypothetical protein
MVYLFQRNDRDLRHDSAGIKRILHSPFLRQRWWKRTCLK